ncbi:hypothetical protein [Hydrogenophaga sp.]|uniref:hypothetical protein n=1 Tax=Hydrogenophaga sp. TaxID=1904254 RepID=UPI0027192E9C|nr:hypothetical protein [Hydrogenophaga sp.]MDO9435386.1 hypothetical protein [Hydrogenophaga sp.]
MNTSNDNVMQQNRVPEAILNPSKEKIQQDAKAVYDIVSGGGIGILHYDVSYAIMSASEEALRHVYAAKGRSFDRASGVVGSFEIHDSVHDLSSEKRAMVRAVTVDNNLPLSVIATYKKDHPFMAKLSPWLLEMATRDGTVNFLLNAGELRDRVAEYCWQEQRPFIASSANASLKGTKYRVEDIEPEVLAAADIVINYGPSRHIQTKSLSSTQIDFRTMKVVRFGIFFEEISAVLKRDFGVELPANPYAA